MQMQNNKYEGTGYVLVGIILGITFTWAVMEYNHMQTLKNFRNCETRS